MVYREGAVIASVLCGLVGLFTRDVVSVILGAVFMSCALVLHTLVIPLLRGELAKFDD